MNDIELSLFVKITLSWTLIWMMIFLCWCIISEHLNKNNVTLHKKIDNIMLTIALSPLALHFILFVTGIIILLWDPELGKEFFRGVYIHGATN